MLARGFPSPSPFALQVVDGNRLDGICRRKAEDLPIKIKLRLETARNRFRPAESVLLAFECQIGHRQPLVADRVRHHLGLVGRHDLVLESLEEDEWTGETVDRMNRRPGAIRIASFRVGSNKAM